MSKELRAGMTCCHFAQDPHRRPSFFSRVEKRLATVLTRHHAGGRQIVGARAGLQLVQLASTPPGLSKGPLTFMRRGKADLTSATVLPYGSGFSFRMEAESAM